VLDVAWVLSRASRWPRNGTKRAVPVRADDAERVTGVMGSLVNGLTKHSKAGSPPARHLDDDLIAGLKPRIAPALE
jgi:hypothetical protein